MQLVMPSEDLLRPKLRVLTSISPEEPHQFPWFGTSFVTYGYEIYHRKDCNRVRVRCCWDCDCHGDNHAKSQSDRSTGRRDERGRFQLLCEIQARNRAGAFPSAKRANKCLDPNVESVALSDTDFVGSE